MSETTAPRRRDPSRADAQRNRARILDVAEKHFTEHSVSGSLQAIAKRAGVGAGTLYRHFPNRDVLLAALLRTRDQDLAARREIIGREAASSADALALWLEALAQWATAFSGLPESLRVALTEGSSPLTSTCQQYITITNDFLSAAQRDGSARAGVRGRELFLAVLAISWVHSADSADEASRSGISRLVQSGWERRGAYR
ncbi:TetR/AcrR family transcriptional regulator [Williamsia sp. D3]|uniref:TetR/AcrR family transcriptional regulator n=1 Tax=Williamsia sp. D3 TaxID=1313067 RepID=UPI0003D316F9|nr:TetR/AcrR family transcriptional regulator [Williamsia sp. D3]ETD33297.1 TetR family transcriptional regulator [Williamsia sp. D3]